MIKVKKMTKHKVREDYEEAKERIKENERLTSSERQISNYRNWRNYVNNYVLCKT